MKQRIATSIAIAAAVLAVAVPSASAAYGIDTFNADVLAKNGDVVTKAGSTPYTGVTEFALTPGTIPLTTDEQVKNIRVDLPPGLISNPLATPQCPQDGSPNAFPNCDADTQIGTVDLTASGVPAPTTKVYNLVPAPGHVSDFGFAVAGLLTTHIIGGVRDTGDYGLFFTISDVPQGINMSYSKLTFFGDPGNADWATGASHAPFIRLPTACTGPQTTKLTIETWEGNTYRKDSVTNDHHGHLIGADGCDQLPFSPTISLTPDTSQRDTPVGVQVGVQVPWQNDPTKLAQAHVKDTAVVLPPGMTINPGAANGLQACTDAQFGQGTHNPITCPAASKIGTASIKSPNLANPLTGDVFLGQPQGDNPYRLFVVANGYGLSVRLKGKVTPDPATGQLTTVFPDTPQVPFTDFKLNLNGGPNATLANPLACGTAPATSTITPYSGNAPATPGTSVTIDADGKGGACPDATPFNIGFNASSANMAAGAFSPFTLNVLRDDGQQYLGGLSITQPAGLLGVIQSVPLCDELFASQGTCPEESRVGTSTVFSGAGTAPFGLSGPVYLAGPYNGAPFSLVIAIRALAGPFDLGTVVVRAPIKVDPTDSHLTIDTQLPTILQGIPLRLRTISVAIDRANFLFNPTSCDPFAVGASFTSTDGATQQASSPYQATGCDALPYAPKMTATTKPAKRGEPAGLRVNLSQAPGEANTKSVSVKVPIQLGARLSTVNQACPEDTFKADPVTCGAGSKVGTVSATTPLLAQPLTGTVYLEAHSGAGKLPTLEAVLQGSGITVDLSGSLDLRNGITSNFGTVPDVPISSFTLDLPAFTANSALQATADLCAQPLKLVATLTGQNGKQVGVNSNVAVPGCTFKLVSASVKKRTATFKVIVPGPGTVKLTGKGLKTVRKSFTAAGTYKVKTSLTKKGVKALKKALKAKKKSKRKLVVRAKASYAPKTGKAASATKKLTFKK